MGNIVKIVYQKQPKELSITCNGRSFDVSSIADKSLEQWVFPFYSDGERWNGLYEELKDFVGDDDFTIQFDGDDASFEILEYVLKYDPVELEMVTQSVVTIMYSEDPFDTKITVNGKSFDVTRIQNRSIDEWMNVIDIRGMHWDGIFNELNKYLDSESYTIYFVGDQEFMNMLIEECPSTVSIFYRDPQVAKLSHSSGTTRRTVSQKISQAAENIGTGSIGDSINQYREAFKNIQNETFEGADANTSTGKRFSRFQIIVLIVGLVVFSILTLIHPSNGLIVPVYYNIWSYLLIWLLLYGSTFIYILFANYPTIQKYIKRFIPFVIIVFGEFLISDTLYQYYYAMGYGRIFCWIFITANAIAYIGIAIYVFIWMFRLYKDRDAFFRPFLLIYGQPDRGFSDEEYEAWKKDHEARLQEAADKLNEAYKKGKESNNNNGKK